MLGRWSTATLSESLVRVQLLEGGKTVIATCRSPQKAEALHGLETSHQGRLVILPLDVMDEASVQVQCFHRDGDKYERICQCVLYEQRTPFLQCKLSEQRVRDSACKIAGPKCSV